MHLPQLGMEGKEEVVYTHRIIFSSSNLEKLLDEFVKVKSKGNARGKMYDKRKEGWL